MGVKSILKYMIGIIVLMMLCDKLGYHTFDDYVAGRPVIKQSEKVSYEEASSSSANPCGKTASEHSMFSNLLSYFLGGVVSGLFGEGFFCVFRFIKRKSKGKGCGCGRANGAMANQLNDVNLQEPMELVIMGGAGNH